jgi:hypothetical protein
MKRTSLLYFFLCLWDAALAQTSCLPKGAVFAHQREIDIFQSVHPGCTDIEGSVVIFGDDVYNLLGLSGIKSIGGSLRIGDPYWWTNLKNLDGLQGLTNIKGGTTIQNNPFLENIVGLTNLESTPSISIINNDSLKSLSGLEKITSIEFGLWIEDNYSLSSIKGLSSLTACNGFKCTFNDMLIDFSGLENLKKCLGNLDVGENKSLNNIVALANLNEFIGAVRIYSNHALTSLDGINNIPGRNITTLTIINNGLLGKCQVQSICDRLAFGAGGINHIQNNGAGCADYIEVINKCKTVSVDEIQSCDFFNIIADFSQSNIFIEPRIPIQSYFISICDVNGRQVLGKSFSMPSHVDISHLSSGIYIMKLGWGKNIEVKKIVKP